MIPIRRHLALALVVVAGLPLLAATAPPMSSMPQPSAMMINPAMRINHAALRRHRLDAAYRGGFRNGAYAMMMYGSNPYGSMMYPMYGMGTGYMMSSGYGSGSGYGSNSYQQRQNSSANYEPYVYVSPYDLPAEVKQNNPLASLRAYGGGLAWPMGLRRVTPTDETSDLLKRIDKAFEALLRQPSDSDRALDTLRDLKRLKKRYEYWVVDAALSSAQRKDARGFLDKVEDALMSVGNSKAQAPKDDPKPRYGDKPANRY
jgi:hypothetical protein